MKKHNQKGLSAKISPAQTSLKFRRAKEISTGFGLIETLLAILILAVVGFGGYYVWTSSKKTNATLNSASRTSQSSAAAAKTLTGDAVKLQKITSESQLNSILNRPRKFNDSTLNIPLETVAPNVDVIKGAPQALIQWAKEYPASHPDDTDISGTVGVTVDYISKNGKFAHAGHTANIWLMLASDKWQEIPGAQAQSVSDCSVIEKYHIPSDIMDLCVKSSEINNSNPVAGWYENLTQ